MIKSERLDLIPFAEAFWQWSLAQTKGRSRRRISVGSFFIEGFLPEKQAVGTDWLRVLVIGGLINFMVTRLLDKRN